MLGPDVRSHVLDSDILLRMTLHGEDCHLVGQWTYRAVARRAKSETEL